MSITGQAYEYFKNETRGEVIHKIQNYSIQANELLTEWSALELAEREQAQITKSVVKLSNLSNNIKNKDKRGMYQDALKPIYGSGGTGERFYNAHRNQFQNLELERQALATKSYLLLNQIGEYITGEQIQYSITLQSPTTGKNITFNMGIQDFLSSAVSFTSKRMDLHGDSTLFKNFESAGIVGEEWNNTDELYNQELFDSFAAIFDYANAISTNGGQSPKQYNKGQILEGYFYYMQTLIGEFNVLSALNGAAATNHLGAGDYSVLVNTLDAISIMSAQTNSRGFWTGGDIGNVQIKGTRASVASYSTLKRQLAKFSVLTNQMNFEKLKGTTEQAASSINAFGNQAIRQIVSGLFEGFMATGVSIEDLNAFSNFNEAAG